MRTNKELRFIGTTIFQISLMIFSSQVQATVVNEPFTGKNKSLYLDEASKVANRIGLTNATDRCSLIDGTVVATHPETPKCLKITESKTDWQGRTQNTNEVTQYKCIANGSLDCEIAPFQGPLPLFSVTVTFGDNNYNEDLLARSIVSFQSLRKAGQKAIIDHYSTPDDKFIYEDLKEKFKKEKACFKSVMSSINELKNDSEITTLLEKARASFGEFTINASIFTSYGELDGVGIIFKTDLDQNFTLLQTVVDKFKDEDHRCAITRDDVKALLAKLEAKTAKQQDSSISKALDDLK